MNMEGMTDKQLLSHTKLELVSYIRQLEQAQDKAEVTTTTDTSITAPTNTTVSYDIFNSNTNKDMWGF
ncbi:hypothetical protein vBEfaS271_02 [Enterococcus phage vB_EfaS-271]|nr:hypothetical protein vBEfaS271_02 [Enterococcus phage vB_EfaS-271]